MGVKVTACPSMPAGRMAMMGGNHPNTNVADAISYGYQQIKVSKQELEGTPRWGSLLDGTLQQINQHDHRSSQGISRADAQATLPRIFAQARGGVCPSCGCGRDAEFHRTTCQRLVAARCGVIGEIDPLDVEYDGVTMRQLLGLRGLTDQHGYANRFTPAQRAAISAHWSADLRAKGAASTAADLERERNRVRVDLEYEDWE